MRRLVTAIVVATVATTGLFAAAAGAEPGDYDGAYGNCGFLDHALTPRVASQGDAIITVDTVAAGPASTHVRIRRLRPDGTTDTTFGARGVATADISGLVQEDEVWSVATDATGAIDVAVTSAFDNGTELQGFGWVVHVRSDGTTDPNYGTKAVEMNGATDIAAMPGGTVFGLTGADFRQPVPFTVVGVDGTASSVNPATPAGGVAPIVRRPLGADDHGVIAFDIAGSGAFRRWLPDGAWDPS